MPDSTASAFPGLDVDPLALLHTLLEVSLTGIILFRPVYAAGSTELLDLAYERLNPAAQQMLRLPECPAESFLTRYPMAQATGIFAFYRDAFLSGQLARQQVNYQHDGLDGYFHLVAQRQGPLLVVSFTDTNDHARSAVEEALRQAQAGELAARAEAEAQRQRFYDVLQRLPAQVAVYHGPDHVVSFVNARFQTFVAAESLLGRPLREAALGAVGAEVFALLDQVYRTGQPVQLLELAVALGPHQAEPAAPLFVNASYQPLYDAQGYVDGVLDFSYDITEQVLARQQVQQLNQELEARVQARTQELEAQQRRLSQILSQVPAAIATLRGPAHCFTFANAPYQRLLHGRAQLGRAVADVQPELVAQGFIEVLDQVYASGQPYVGQAVLLQLSQPAGPPTAHYFDFTYQPLTDGQDRVQGILAFAVEVTEQVLARRQAATLQAAVLAAVQRQRQERENVYQLFTQAPAAICLLREPAHRVEYLNPAYQALFPGQLIQGQTLMQFQPAATELLALFDGVYQTGASQFQGEVPVQLVQPAGPATETRYFDFTYAAYREQGQVAGVSLFGVDVTPRVRARQQRDAQQAELQRILEQAPVPITVLRGPTLTVELANTAISEVWGRPASQTVGRPYFEAVPETAGQGFEEILAGVVQTGKPFFLKEAPVTLNRAHTGRPAQGYFNFVFQPLRDEQQRPVGVVAVGAEVTEQVLARQQVQQLNEELRHTNADLDTFVYTASHDLKAPITNLEGLLTALREQLPPTALAAPLVTRLLALLDDAVARFLQTLTHLADIAQLQQVEAPRAVDLAVLITDVCLDLAPLVQATGAQLTVDVAACPTVRCAPKTLRSVVYNLLSNAIKYHAPDRVPEVSLRCQAEAGQVVLTVQDNGLGLSAAQQGQLFGLFRRLHTHVEGSGVGLFMVKRLLENAGGTLTVQSELGVGSTFTVTLPA